MYTQIEIRDNICLILKKQYPEINLYDKQNMQEFEAPAFFVYVRKVSSKDYLFLNTSTLSISIYYFAEDLNDLEDDYIIKEDELNKLFRCYFQINNSKFLIKDKKFVRDEDFLLFNFYVDINVLDYSEDDYKNSLPKMKKIKTNINIQFKD